MRDSLRNQGLKKLLRKYELEPDHARQVCKISLEIFDKTKGELHNFSDRERDLLEAGSLLHDIGYYRSSLNHNQHSYDILINEGVEGFSRIETEIIANIARFHKGKKPCKKYECYYKLEDKNIRKMVKQLSGICRIADGLDRTHISAVGKLDCIYDSFSQTLFLLIKSSIPNCDIEIFTAERKKSLFEDEFNVQVRFKIM